MTQSVSLRPNQPLIQGRDIDASKWAVMREQAAMLVKSGFLPSSIRTAEQAISIMMLGSELDVPPWGALSTINVIQGKPTVSPQLMLGLIERSKQAEQIDIKGDDRACVVTMKRRGRAPHTTTFSMDDAQKLGLAGKDNYQKQPGVMLQWRAVAACARVCFPDVILGLFTPDEMGADVVFTDTGEMTIAPEPFTVQVGEMPPAAASHARAWDEDQGEEIPFPEMETITPPSADQLALYQRGIRRATELGLDCAPWEILAGATAPEVQAAIDAMIAAVRAKEQGPVGV